MALLLEHILQAYSIVSFAYTIGPSSITSPFAHAGPRPILGFGMGDRMAMGSAKSNSGSDTEWMGMLGWIEHVLAGDQDAWLAWNEH